MRIFRLLSVTVLVCAHAFAQHTPLTTSGTGPTAHAAAPLTNADVIALASVGMDDAIILAKIDAATSTSFDVSVDGLKALKGGGVSNDVIRVIVSHTDKQQQAANENSDDPNVKHQPGVYILLSGRDGQVHLQMLEHTHTEGEKTSGNALAMSYGMGKRHTKQTLAGAKSPIQIDDHNPTFYVYIPEDTQSFGGSDLSVRDFALLRLHTKSKVREVQVSAESNTGMGYSGVEDKIREQTTSKKVKPGIYMVKMVKPLKSGEYAFEHETEGVFYDFGVSEAR